MPPTTPLRRAAALALAAALLGTPAGAQEAADPGSAGQRALQSAPALERLLDPEDGKVGPDRELGAHEARALIEPGAEAVLSSDIGGRILELPVDSGEAFAKGDLLIGFDCSFHQAELAAARAELIRARRVLANTQQLAQLNSVGQLDVALAEADVAKANAQVRTRGLYVQRCQIRAPYDGRVVERPVNRYETVGKDQELMSVIASAGLRVRLIVPSRWLAWLAPGARFELKIDETGRTHAAEVTTIGARIDPVSQTVPLRGRLVGDRPADLLPGMSGTAQFDAPNG